MAWTTPRTWVAGETVTAALLNTHVRDNDAYLKDTLTNVSNQDVIIADARAFKHGALNVLRAAGSKSHVESGVVSMSLAQYETGTQPSGAFATNFGNTNYRVVVSVTPAGCGAGASAKAVNGFTMNLKNILDTTQTVTVEWIAVGAD